MKEETIYGSTYTLLQAEILAISGMTGTELCEAAEELNLLYNFFLTSYTGPYIHDHFSGFEILLRDCVSNGEYCEESKLNDLTPAQYYLLWAWQCNKLALYSLKNEVVGSPEKYTMSYIKETLNDGIGNAVTAHQALLKAKFLLGISTIADAYNTPMPAPVPA